MQSAPNAESGTIPLTALFGKKLVDSAADGKLHQVRKILEHSARQVDLDHVSEDGGTALQAACRNGHDEVVTFLLVEGARPDTPLWAPNSRSAICHAVAFGGDDVSMTVSFDEFKRIMSGDKRVALV